MTLLRQLVFLASWRLSVRHFFTQRREVAKEERSAMRDLLELGAFTGTLPKSRASIALVFLATLRLCVRRFHFTQRREDAKEERSAMRDLIELSGVTGTLPVMTTVRRDLS
jgi:hypothetical protein